MPASAKRRARRSSAALARKHAPVPPPPPATTPTKPTDGKSAPNTKPDQVPSSPPPPSSPLQQILRVGCWNILASEYTRWNTPDGKPESAQQRDRRWYQTVTTIAHYQPDVVCLQESTRAFLSYAFEGVLPPSTPDTPQKQMQHQTNQLMPPSPHSPPGSREAAETAATSGTSSAASKSVGASSSPVTPEPAPQKSHPKSAAALAAAATAAAPNVTPSRNSLNAPASSPVVGTGSGWNVGTGSGYLPNSSPTSSSSSGLHKPLVPSPVRLNAEPVVATGEHAAAAGALKVLYHFAWCPRVFPKNTGTTNTGAKTDGCALLYRRDRFAPPQLAADSTISADDAALTVLFDSSSSSSAAGGVITTSLAVATTASASASASASAAGSPTAPSPTDVKTAPATPGWPSPSPTSPSSPTGSSAMPIPLTKFATTTSSGYHSLVKPLNFPTLRTPNDPRVCIAVCLADAITGHPFAIVQSVHLEGDPKATPCRVKQLVEAAGVLQSLQPPAASSSSSSPLPAMLCGDFNDPSAPNAPIASALSDVSAGGLRHITTVSEAVPDGVTSLFGAIDHVFANSGLAVDGAMRIVPAPAQRIRKGSGVSLASSLVGCPPTPYLDPPYLDATWSSDHFFLLQRFKVVGGNTNSK